MDELTPELKYVRSGRLQMLLSQDVYGYGSGYRSVERLIEKLHL